MNVRKMALIVVIAILYFLVFNQIYHWIHFSERTGDWFFSFSLIVTSAFVYYIIFYPKVDFHHLNWKRYEYIIHVSGAIIIIAAFTEVNHIRLIKDDMAVSTANINKVTHQLDNIVSELPSRELNPFPNNVSPMIECIKKAEKSLIIYTDAPAYGCISNPEDYINYKQALIDLFAKPKFETLIIIQPCRKQFSISLQNQFILTKKLKNNDLNTKLSAEDSIKLTHCINLLNRRNKNRPIDKDIEGKLYYTYNDFLDYANKIDQRLLDDLKFYSQNGTGNFVDISLERPVENGYWLFDADKTIYSFISKDSVKYSEPTFYSENKDLNKIINDKIWNDTSGIVCYIDSENWIHTQ